MSSFYRALSYAAVASLADVAAPDETAAWAVGGSAILATEPR